MILRRLFIVAIFLNVVRVSVGQQSTVGILSGTVQDASDRSPLSGVSIHVTLHSDNPINRYTYSNAQGEFRFKDLFPGQYTVVFSVLGYISDSVRIDVSGSHLETVHMQLHAQPLESQDVVVTASRHEEKETHSPASISVVTPAEVREQIAATPTDILKNVPGIDVAQEGIAMGTYASRSFHSVFGSDVLTMNDYHSLEVPAIGGFYGILLPQNMEDIDHVEVVRGPGSALYGPEAATGVVNFISKSPFASQGTNLSFAGGERDYVNANFRNDEAIGDRFAFSISGRYLAANDWQVADDPKEDAAKLSADSIQNVNHSLSSSQRDSLSRIGNRNYKLETYSFNAHAEAILSDEVTLHLQGGLTNIQNDIAMTEDFGDAQIKNWLYDFGQARLTYKDLFIQASINHDNTSGSYFLPTGAPIVDRSSTYAAQIQHRWDPASNEKLTYGADYEAIRPITESTIYGPDDGHANVNIFGAYLQSQTSVLDDHLELVLAGRFDKHSALTNPIFSPRAAAVYHLDEDNLFRAMYNVTYLFPSITDLYADLFYTTEGPYGVRYVSPYVSGTYFTPNADGSYNMNTPLPAFDSMPLVPSMMTTAQAQAKLWPIIMDLAAKAANQPLLKIIPAPTQNVSYLAYANVGANASSQPFIPVPNGTPLSISGVQPQHQQTYELDYQGSFSRSLQVEVDAYQTHYSVIRASTVALTPVVVFDSAKLYQYFSSEFGNLESPDTVAKLAGELSKAPLGVVQANGGAQNEAYPDDILVGTRSYLTNTINFYGIDVFGTYKANADWSFDGSFSWLNKNYWYGSELNPQDSTVQAPFALNLPKYRFSIGAKYSGLARGLNVELRDRWSDAFPMVDNYWIGNVGAWNVLDLTMNYTVESWNNLQFTLSVTNLLGNVHQEFVGAPYIGRLTVLRASYALPAL